MQHFAHITNGIVDQVIVIDAETLATGFWGDPASWVETCSNTYGNQNNNGGMPFRKNFAQVGSTYDVENDAFIFPKPYESWILNSETYLWEAPVPRPQNTQNPWVWDESIVNWVELT
jgi:hypothetical protein